MSGLAGLLSLVLGMLTLVGTALVVRLGTAPPSPLVFLAVLLGTVLASLASMALGSFHFEGRWWRRVCTSLLALCVTVGMALGLLAIAAFAVDLTSHGVPIITGAGQVTVYAATQVPMAGWGFDLQRPALTGNWLGNVSASLVLILVATLLSVAALRATAGQFLSLRA